MASKTIPFPKAGNKHLVQPLSRDPDIAERTRRAVAELQIAMDEAVLAGLVVEPCFSRIEQRFAGKGMRIDSFVCKVGIYRGLA